MGVRVHVRVRLQKYDFCRYILLPRI